MIPLAEINRFAENLQVPAETIEKDYMISWVLVCLSKSNLKNHFIFYGGTAIKRIYFEEHRFSEDIDLLSKDKFAIDEILEALRCLEYGRKLANILLEIDHSNIKISKDRIQLYVKYTGYDEIIGAPKEIRLDFTMNMPLYGKIIDSNLIETYSDLLDQDVKLSVMSLNTILANKLGLLTDRTRNEPRDLFDIWFLLQHTDKFDYNLNEIRDAFREKYSYKPSISVLKPYLNINQFKTNWDKRLRKQVPRLPNIEIVIKEISAKLEALFSKT